MNRQIWEEDEKNYFSDTEIQCPCCGYSLIQRDFLGKMNKAREIAGIPFKINSWCRCTVHNHMVGGKKDSEHVNGYGADIEAATSRQRGIILAALREAGINRIGIAKTFIHAGGSMNKDRDVTWLY